MEIFLIFWFLCCVATAVIGSKKSGTLGAIFGLFVGLLLGPIGVIWALLSPGRTKSCFACKKAVHKDATKCPYCQSIQLPPTHFSPSTATPQSQDATVSAAVFWKKPKILVCAGLFAILGVLILAPLYSKYRDRVAAEKAEAERVERVIHNTPIIWNDYRAIQKKNPAALSLDDTQSVRIKGDQMIKLLEYDIDPDLRNHIQARVRLIDTGIALMQEALAGVKKIRNDSTVNSFLAGMVGGLLVPDDPVRAGMVFGEAAASGSRDKEEALANQIKRSTQALIDEDKKLDAYETELEALLRQRYK